jgi:hypothetical protein
MILLIFVCFTKTLLFQKVQTRVLEAQSTEEIFHLSGIKAVSNMIAKQKQWWLRAFFPSNPSDYPDNFWFAADRCNYVSLTGVDKEGITWAKKEVAVQMWKTLEQRRRIGLAGPRPARSVETGSASTFSYTRGYCWKKQSEY